MQKKRVSNWLPTGKDSARANSPTGRSMHEFEIYQLALSAACRQFVLLSAFELFVY